MLPVISFLHDSDSHVMKSRKLSFLENNINGIISKRHILRIFKNRERIYERIALAREFP